MLYDEGVKVFSIFFVFSVSLQDIFSNISTVHLVQVVHSVAKNVTATYRILRDFSCRSTKLNEVNCIIEESLVYLVLRYMMYRQIAEFQWRINGDYSWV